MVEIDAIDQSLGLRRAIVTFSAPPPLGMHDACTLVTLVDDARRKRTDDDSEPHHSFSTRPAWAPSSKMPPSPFPWEQKDAIATPTQSRPESGPERSLVDYREIALGKMVLKLLTPVTYFVSCWA